ncbi:MAG: NPCBM/NEW2 domain-containing protein [Actinobacteria bacterium]|nr:NPCBM/NEW2 domain-containing protein [Actinomycetota bacterium]
MGRGRTRIVVLLSAFCLVLAGVTAWALTTRSSRKTPAGPAYWVATDGDDHAAGSRDAPWGTLQHAADEAPPGSTVYVRGGVYPQRMAVAVSGAPGRPIVFRNAPVEHPVLDGSSLEVGQEFSPMISVDGERYVEIRGFEIRGYRTDLSGHNPVGILVTGASDHISIVGNVVHDMGTTFQGRIGGDAHGIAVYGNLADHPIDDVVISDNRLYDLTLGSSEALVVNGNVTDFLIQDNVVHDTNNIGIVAIGYEGTAPDPSVDVARDGTIRGNTVYNVDSYGNPAYGTDRSANGIYVDGGRDVLVEGNIVHDVNVGMEFASEHHGRSTSFVTARNNVVYDATAIGIAIGGYDRHRGFTEGCVIVNNTVYETNGVELLVQFDTRDNVIENNIFVAGPTAEFVENRYTENANNLVDHNLYWSTDGSDRGIWQWKDRRYADFAEWRARSGVDRHSVFADPGFVDPTAHDFQLTGGSPAVDAGTFIAAGGTIDLAGEPRQQAAATDLGAYERTAPPPSPTPSIAGAVEYASDLEWASETNGWGPAERDRSNGERAPDDGNAITLGTTRFERGIGAHAPSRIVIDLSQPCLLFLADVGIDEEVGDRGSVEFQVWGDGKMLASSGVLRGPQTSVSIAADLRSVQQLALVVTKAGDGNAYDHADWANARLSC